MTTLTTRINPFFRLPGLPSSFRGFFSSEIDSLRTVLQKTSMPKERREAIEPLYTQAIAIKEKLAPTHYTFLHAQSSLAMVLKILHKEIMSRDMDSSLLQDFEFLRCPKQAEHHRTIDFYRDNQHTHDTDDHTRDDLLSVDACFLNAEIEESALYYLACNNNAGNLSKTVQTAVEETLQRFYPIVSQNEIKNTTASLMQVMPKIKAPCGNLFAICIPKEDTHKIVYRAHPYGKACDCHDKMRDDSILRGLQNGEMNRSNLCAGHQIPQYRIWSRGLSQGNGQQVHCFSPIETDQQEQIREVVRLQIHNLNCIASSLRLKPAF